MTLLVLMHQASLNFAFIPISILFGLVALTLVGPASGDNLDGNSVAVDGRLS